MKILLTSLFIMSGLLSFSQTCLELPPIGGVECFSCASAGWTFNANINTPDIITGNGPHPGGGSTISNVNGATNDGGNMAFVGTSESITTTLTGLTVGQLYTFTVEWQQVTITGDKDGIITGEGGELEIVIVGTPNPTIATAYTSVGNAADGWQTAVGNFTAGATSVTVKLGILAGSGLVIFNSNPEGSLVINELTCCDVSLNTDSLSFCDNGSGQGLYDLISLENSITGGAGFPVNWYSNSQATNLIPNPSNYFSTATTVYAVATSASCSDTVAIPLLIQSLPLVNNQVIQACETILGSSSATGVNLTLLDNAINGGNGNAVSWFSDALLTVPIINPNNFTVNNNDVFYTLVDNGICTDTAAVTYMITGTITLTNPNDSLCEEGAGSNTVNNIDLISYNSQIYAGTATFNWYADINLTNAIATPTNITITGGITDTFYVNVVTGNCNNSIAITFNVLSLPVTITASLSACDEGGNQAVFDLTTLNNTVDGGFGNTIDWFSDPGTTAAIGNPNTYTSTASTVYVRVTDAFCMDTASVSLIINPIVITSETVTICNGDSVFAGGQFQLLAGIYNDTLIGVLGCDSIIETEVMVNDILMVNAYSDVSICKGASAIINALATGGDGNYSYNWDNGLGNAQQFNVSPNTTTTYQVTATDNCGSSPATSIVTVTVLALSQVSFSANVIEGCSPLSVEFSNLSNTQNITSYQWTFGDNTLSSGSVVNHIYNNEGDYSITLTITTDNGCVNDTTFFNYVTVHPTPTARFVYSPIEITTLNPEVHFSSESILADIYSWDFSSEGFPATSNISNPTVEYSSEHKGKYLACLEVTSLNQCVDQTCKYLLVRSTPLVYMPNSFTPNGDGVNDRFLPVTFGISEENYSFLIFNRWGELLFETQNTLNSWDGLYKGKEVPSGIYTWRLDYKDENEVRDWKVGNVNVLK